MAKYGIKHKVATTYHPQSSGQDAWSNREVKRILEKVFNPSKKEWSKHLDNAMWAYITALKILFGMYPYRLIYGKYCHIPIELQHKVFWTIKKLSFSLHVVRHTRIFNSMS